jgi:hypothetical protein
MSDKLSPQGESAVRLAMKVARLTAERDEARAAVERVRALADALYEVHPQPTPLHTRKALLAALDTASSEDA